VGVLARRPAERIQENQEFSRTKQFRRRPLFTVTTKYEKKRKSLAYSNCKRCVNKKQKKMRLFLITVLKSQTINLKRFKLQNRLQIVSDVLCFLEH